MKQFNFFIILVSVISFFSCDDGVGETVETSNILFPKEEYRYKFSRNGQSSVDYYQISLLEEPLGLIQRYLSGGFVTNTSDYNTVIDYYNNGRSHVKPVDEVASSSHVDTQKINEDILSLIDKARYLKKGKASEGISGFSGIAVNDPNRVFVNENGIALSEVFKMYIQGAIYFDKLLNVHLDEDVFNDKNLRENHENTVLLSGRNYTALEHHWDLAYGYFLKLQSLSQADGLPLLKGVERKLLDEFYLGRYDLERFRYDLVRQHIQEIREEFSRVIAIRVMDLLVGNITRLNYEENPKQAFKFISRGYGAIYALQFTRKPDGTKYFTYNEVLVLMSELEGDRGFWNEARILGDETTSGSLKNIASKVGAKFEITIKDILK